MKRHGEGERGGGRGRSSEPRILSIEARLHFGLVVCFPKIVGLFDTSSRDVRWRGRGLPPSETTSTSLHCGKEAYMTRVKQCLNSQSNPLFTHYMTQGLGISG
jgi:hypothetical protein